MRAKNLFLGLVACFCLAFAIVGAQGEELQKVSPDNSGFTIMPVNPPGDDPNGAISVGAPPTTAVPEASTIAMMFLGAGMLGGLMFLRRSRRA